jgi:integrase/recombinase XerD
LFGLIAVTGLRISEALKLDDDDVDLDAGVVTVKRGKNDKARYVPIAPSTEERLAVYRNERTRLLGKTAGAFLRNDDGRRPTDCCARYNFAVVTQNMKLREAQRFCRHGRGPRIHDLRHTFAVRTIMSWYRKGLDPEREMIKLTTYLGHSKPDHTYWYIEAVPELLQLASQRAEQSLAQGAAKKGGVR